MMRIFAIIEMLNKNGLHWVCWPMEATFIENRQTKFIECMMWIHLGSACIGHLFGSHFPYRTPCAAFPCQCVAHWDLGGGLIITRLPLNGQLEADLLIRRLINVYPFALVRSNDG